MSWPPCFLEGKQPQAYRAPVLDPTGSYPHPTLGHLQNVGDRWVFHEWKHVQAQDFILAGTARPPCPWQEWLAVIDGWTHHMVTGTLPTLKRSPSVPPSIPTHSLHISFIHTHLLYQCSTSHTFTLKPTTPHDTNTPPTKAPSLFQILLQVYNLNPPSTIYIHGIHTFHNHSDQHKHYQTVHTTTNRTSLPGVLSR